MVEQLSALIGVVVAEYVWTLFDDSVVDRVPLVVRVGQQIDVRVVLVDALNHQIEGNDRHQVVLQVLRLGIGARLDGRSGQPVGEPLPDHYHRQVLDFGH